MLERAWAVLIQTARNRETISYGVLGREIGYPNIPRRIVGEIVAPVSRACDPYDYPDIAALVVRKDTGYPGIGYFNVTGGVIDLDYWQERLEEAWAFKWPKRMPRER